MLGLKFDSSSMGVTSPYLNGSMIVVDLGLKIGTISPLNGSIMTSSYVIKNAKNFPLLNGWLIRKIFVIHTNNMR